MINPRHNTRDIYPDTGPEISAKSWLTEAPMRMLMNNLHPDVAENPHELVVYGGIGRAARSWTDFDRILEALAETFATRDPTPESPYLLDFVATYMTLFPGEAAAIVDVLLDLSHGVFPVRFRHSPRARVGPCTARMCYKGAMTASPGRASVAPQLVPCGVAVAASLALVIQQLGALDLPGCGLEGADRGPELRPMDRVPSLVESPPVGTEPQLGDGADLTGDESVEGLEAGGAVLERTMELVEPVDIGAPQATSHGLSVRSSLDAPISGSIPGCADRSRSGPDAQQPSADLSADLVGVFAEQRGRALDRHWRRGEADRGPGVGHGLPQLRLVDLDREAPLHEVGVRQGLVW